MKKTNKVFKTVHVILFCTLSMGVSCPRKDLTARWTIKTTNQESNIILLGPKLTKDQIYNAIGEWFKSKGQDPLAPCQGSPLDCAAVFPDPYYVERPEDIDLAFATNPIEEKELDRRCFHYFEKMRVFGIIPETIDNQFCVQKINFRDIFILTFLTPQGRAETAELAFSDLRKFLITRFGGENLRHGELNEVVRRKFKNSIP